MLGSDKVHEAIVFKQQRVNRLTTSTIPVYLTGRKMRSLCSGVIYLALCSCFVAALDLDGCLRGPLFVETAKSSKSLRKEIKEALGFSVDGNGTIAGVLVISKTRNESVYAVFAGRNKVELIALKHYKFELRKGPRRMPMRT